MANEVKGLVQPTADGTAIVDVPRPIDIEQYNALASSVFDKTADPTVDDDADAGYFVGSKWMNISASRAFVCLDNTNDAAVWAKTTYGDDFQYVEGESEDTNATTTYSQKARLSWTPPVQGDYVIDWAIEATVNNALDRCQIQIELDDTTVLNETNYEPEGGDEYITMCGFKKVNLTSAVHTIDIDFRLQGGPLTGTAKVRRARIKARRVG